MTSDKHFSVLLVDDHPLFRRGVISLLPKTNFEVTEASDGREAIGLVSVRAFDVVILDENMPNIKGFEAAKRMLQLRPGQKIIVMTQYDELALIMNFVKMGVKGFLTKQIDSPLLVSAINAVVNGAYYFHSRFDEQIERFLSRKLPATIPKIRFSPREIQVIVALSTGKKNADVAEQLGVSIRSVETYRYRLIQKTGVANATELVSFIYANAIL